MSIVLEQKLTRENFKALPPLSTDGAWGTEMQKLGAKPGQMCDTWNVDEPEKVLSVAQSYIDAGSDIILTNTFNCNRVILAKHNMADRVAELNKAGAAISKKAAAGKGLVFASCGPTGLLVTTGLMLGNVQIEDIEAIFAEQAAALEEGGADAIVIETQNDAAEAEAALKGALKATKIPVGLSFTFDSGEGGMFTMMGVSVAQAYQIAKDNGASFVGANCGRGIDTCVAIAQEFAKCGKELPIWIKGNAGKPEVDADGKTLYKATPDVYANAVKPLLEAGAHFIGGCCGSNPGHIKAVAQTLGSLKCGCKCNCKD